VPTVDNGTIFTADSYGNILRIDQSDGTIINHFHSKRKFSSGTAVSSDSIFVTTVDGYLLSIDKAAGKIKWQAQLPTIAVETPQVSDGIVVIRTNDAEILAYNASTGSLLWVYQKPIPSLTLRVYNTFQIIGKDVIIVGQPGGRMALINLNTGVPIWENYVALPVGATDLDKLTDVSVRPVLNDRQICVATFNGKITCIDAISSSMLWSKNFSTSYGVLVDTQNVYSISQDGVLFAYDKNTGGRIWSNDVLQYRSLSVPVFLNNNILVVDKEGNLYLFNRNDGHMVATKSSALKDGVAYPWADGKKVILQSGNGAIAEITQ
jgi:outer membrane protein assembly factor BamB